MTGKQEDPHASEQTISVNGDSNPTNNNVIKFDIQLPTDEQFKPELQCEIYDHMLSDIILY